MTTLKEHSAYSHKNMFVISSFIELEDILNV